MLEVKKPVAWIPLLIVGIFILLIKFIVGNNVFYFVAGMVIFIALICFIFGSKEYKERVKAMEMLEASGDLADLKLSIANGTAVYFKKGEIIANDTTVLENGKNVTMVKLDNVANAYKSNIINQKYDYNSKLVAIECKDGYIRFMYVCNRKSNPDFDAFLAYVKNHIIREVEG